MRIGAKRSGRVCLVLILMGCIIFPSMIPSFSSAATTTTAAIPVVTKEWNLPLLTVLTGPVAFAGKPTQWGAEYAMKKINASGGIRGVPIKIISYDTAMDNSKAVQVMARAISGNLIVLGPIDLGGTTATSNLIQDNHIFQIAMSGTPAILQSIAPYGGNIMGNIVILNRACGLKWLELQPKIKNVAYFHNPSIPGVTDQLAAVAEAFNKVGVTIIPIELTATQIDFGPSVVKAINANADGYYSSYNITQHISIAKDLANRGITPGPKYLGSFGSNGSALFTVGKGYLEDTYLWENLNQVDTSPAWQQFVKDYQVNFPGELPQSNSLAFYDAVYAFKTAVEALGITGDPTKLSSEREKIATFLYNSPELQGFQFTYKYVNGMKIMPHFLLQIKNNAFQLAAKVQ